MSARRMFALVVKDDNERNTKESPQNSHSLHLYTDYVASLETQGLLVGTMQYFRLSSLARKHRI